MLESGCEKSQREGQGEMRYSLVGWWLVVDGEATVERLMIYWRVGAGSAGARLALLQGSLGALPGPAPHRINHALHAATAIHIPTNHRTPLLTAKVAAPAEALF